jgi:hypothetical protein
MRNPLPGGPGGFLSGAQNPSPCRPYYSCGAAAVVLVGPEYSPIRPTPRAVSQKNMVIYVCPPGPGNKNDCAGGTSGTLSDRPAETIQANNL